MKVHPSYCNDQWACARLRHFLSHVARLLAAGLAREQGRQPEESISDSFAAWEENNVSIETVTKEMVILYKPMVAQLEPSVQTLLQAVLAIGDPANSGMDEVVAAITAYDAGATNNVLLRNLRVFEQGQRMHVAAQLYLKSFDKFVDAARKKDVLVADLQELEKNLDEPIMRASTNSELSSCPLAEISTSFQNISGELERLAVDFAQLYRECKKDSREERAPS